MVDYQNQIPAIKQKLYFWIWSIVVLIKNRCKQYNTRAQNTYSPKETSFLEAVLYLITNTQSKRNTTSRGISHGIVIATTVIVLGHSFSFH